VEAQDDLNDQILEELNIKSLEFIQDDTDLATYVIKPNFATLDAKYGQSVGAIRGAIATLNPAETARRLKKGGAIELSLATEKLYLTAEDLIVERQDAAHRSAIFEADYTVAIDTELTEDLQKEGYVRDLIRQIQTLRKDADFRVEDRITVSIETTDPIWNALNRFMDYFKRETLALSVVQQFQKGEIDKEFIIDGNKVRVSVSRNE
jgi:isoleucyl-tRNA synthetase